ncbi:MAG: glycosyltransferase [Armatimonadota bacterium]
MTKVLYIETPSGYGGSMQSLLDLIRHLPDGIEAHLVAPYDVRKYRELPSNVRTVDLLQRPNFPSSHLGVLLRKPWWTRQTLRLIRRYRVQLVHGNNDPYAHIGALYAARLARIPMVVSVRNFVTPRKQMRIGARRYDAYLAISQAVRRNLVDLGIPLEKTHLVYNPIALPKDPTPKVPNPIPVVGMHGMLLRWKGQDVFLRALRLLRDRGAGFRAQIAGTAPFDEGDFPGELRRLCRDLRLDDIVHWVGFVSDPYRFLAGLDVSVHASVEPEPLGRVVAEAMLAGVPVIGTDGGGVPEMIIPGETGRLVPMGDAQAMADAIHDALTNMEQSLQMAERARQRAMEMFDPVEHAREVVGVYESLTRR